MSRKLQDWEDVDDPEGRLRKGMLCRWKHSSYDRPEMKILQLCAPAGLYWRPVHEDDPDYVKEMAALAESSMYPCEADHPEAVYRPENLMVCFCYLRGGGTTARALDLVEWKQEGPLPAVELEESSC